MPAFLQAADAISLAAVGVFVLAGLILILTRKHLRSWRFGIFFESQRFNSEIDQQGKPVADSPPEADDQA